MLQGEECMKCMKESNALCSISLRTSAVTLLSVARKT